MPQTFVGAVGKHGMLRTLRIRNLAVVEDLLVEFGPGLNLLTGETGAGKSILVGALGLAAGDRARSALVRKGAERAVVEAEFVLTGEFGEASFLAERGVDVQDDVLTIRRELVADGGGRVLVNGSPTTVTVLREVGSFLLDLHQQHEHRTLLSGERQLDFLDRFGECGDRLRRVRNAYAAVVDAGKRVEELLRSARDREVRMEELESVVREIDTLAPRPGEWEVLGDERKLLRNAGRAAELLDHAVRLLYEGEPSVAAMAAAAARHVRELATLDRSLAGLADRLEAGRLEMEDAALALRDYRRNADFDPARTEQVESRHAALEHLRLKYGRDEEGLLDLRDRAARQIEELRDVEAGIERARKDLEAAEEEYGREAAALSKAREAAAKKLAKAVERQLRSLALQQARFSVRLAPAAGPTVSRTGVPLHARGAERATFVLAANPGEAALPLSRVASGGELSRVMLALRVVLERSDGDRALVFDEVDAGVGGAVADAVGRRLAALARRQQVLCVTHLPQVAAYADHHYHVRKEITAGRTRADVLPLTRAGRVDELARMLGGREITSAARRNARELLARAGEPPRQAVRREA